MSTYHGRRAPNVSQYIANLNTIPSNNHEIPSDLSIGDGDLDFLTNAEFFDFDSFNPSGVDFHPPTHTPSDGGRFQFDSFPHTTYPTPVTPSSAGGLGHRYAAPPPPHTAPFTAPNVGDKRKQSLVPSIPSPQDLEEQSRMAAEEDKRRRNTAASARFRVKKKQREQALEKQAKDMADKVSLLEGKVQQLEMENKWLKGLITDKNEGKPMEGLQMEKTASERKPDDHTTGVGTAEDEIDEDEDADAEEGDEEFEFEE